MKLKIDEIAKLAEQGDPDGKLRHACSRTSYKDMSDQLKSEETRLAELQKDLRVAKDSKLMLINRMKKGNFSLEGLPPTKGDYEEFY